MLAATASIASILLAVYWIATKGTIKLDSSMLIDYLLEEQSEIY